MLAELGRDGGGMKQIRLLRRPRQTPRRRNSFGYAEKLAKQPVPALKIDDFKIKGARAS